MLHDSGATRPSSSSDEAPKSSISRNYGNQTSSTPPEQSVSAAKRFKVRDIIVDEVGVGAGVLDNLKADRRFKAQGINGGSRPANTEKYLNLRAETFDGLRARFQDGDISIPNDPELISQIASLTYRYNARGQLQLESKDQIRSTGRQSPDKADAIALAFADSIKTRPRPSIKFLHPTYPRKTQESQEIRPPFPRLNRPKQRTAPHRHNPVGAVREPPPTSQP